MILIGYFKMKDFPILERPREKLKEYGVHSLSDSELLSIIIRTGISHKNVYELSIDIFNHYSLEELKEVSIYDLTKITGIGEVKAIEILAAIELGKRIFFKSSSFQKLDTPESIWKDSLYFFHSKKQEYFYCYYFDNKQKLIQRKLIFIGTINSSVTHIREVFKEAYKLSATSIVCLHNHPSNDVTPSIEDRRFTNSLMETGKMQGIPVIDHIIVGNNQYYSFYEDNAIKN